MKNKFWRLGRFPKWNYTASRKDGWDKVRIIGTIIAAVLTPITITIIGYSISIAVKNQETEVSAAACRRDDQFKRKTGF